MEATSGSIVYAIGGVPGFAPAAHAPRIAQSQTAADLLTRIRDEAFGPDCHVSKSHSRGMAAAAAASSLAGVDIEFMRPGRAGSRILALFMDGVEPDVDDRAFYRAWTFGEAHYKAFGKNPSPAMITGLLSSSFELDRAYELSGVSVLHLEPQPDFMFSLVWSGHAAPRRLAV